jgi:hypothetical protein
MEQPTRIDLLELDIDLRLTELWREAADVSEWNLEVVSAFMRAAYGKGYCDALTEDAPGSLCLEHGYDVPRRRDRDAARGCPHPRGLRGVVSRLSAWHGSPRLPAS